MTTTYCKDCAHCFAQPHQADPQFRLCRRTETIDLVMGGKQYNYCSIERQPTGIMDRCGIEGKYWTTKEPQ
jgi:hypothetical protein